MLITNFDELRRVLEPVLRGDVGVAAFDTETSEIHDDRFTPWGTDSRIAGFSASFNIAGDPIDFYAAVRHRPYDWRRRRDLIERDRGTEFGQGKNKHPRQLTGAEWIALLEAEGVTADGWAPGMDPNLPLDEVRDLWRELFAVAGMVWRAHNWPFDAKMLMADGVTIPWDRVEDTLIDSVFTDERPLDLYDEQAQDWVHKGHSLKHLGEEYLGVPPDAQTKLKEATAVLKCMSYAHLPLRRIIAPYACMDTRLTYDFAECVRTRKLWTDGKVQALIGAHHKEMQRVVEMESRGICVDVEEAEKRAEAMEQEQSKIRVRAQQAANQTVVPLDNPQELESLIYDRFGLPVYREQKNTRKATLKQVRNKLAGGTPVTAGSEITQSQAIDLLDCILDYRRTTKELTAFYRPLVDFGGDEGIIYPILSALRAKTTRYSAAKPNIQQMVRPKKGHEIESVRALIKPRDGHVLLPLDYATQELRVAAHYARAIPDVFEYRFTWRCTLERRGDCKGRPPHGKGEIHLGRRPNFSRAPEHMNLVEGFLSGDREFDPHAAMVKRCHELGIMIDRDTEAKPANFGLIYGAGIFKTAETLDCSYDRAKTIFDVFWNKAYPELGRVKEFIGERLRRHGPSGRWSHQHSIRTIHGGAVFLDGSHKGLNYIVQRSCREILLHAILTVADYLEAEAPEYKLLFPVHDELVIEAPADSVDQTVVRNMARLMVEAGSACSIPMIVDPAICRDNWAEKEELDPVTYGYNGVTDSVEVS